jgi:hypothetical protein
LHATTKAHSRRWLVISLALVSVVALVLAIVLFFIPIGLISDSECGLPIQAATRPEFNSVCNPPGRTRLALVAILVIVSAVSAVGSYMTYKRSRQLSS